MYTLPNAVHLKDHLLERWEAADRDPSLVEDGALNVVIVGGGPTGVETAGALAELYRADFAGDYPSLPQEQARVILVEAGPGAVLDVQAEAPRVRGQGSGRPHRRGDDRRDGRVRLADPRHAEIRRGAQGAHARLGRRAAGQPARQTLGIELQRGNRIAVGPDLTLPDHPEVYALGDVAAIMDEKTEQVLPSSGRSRSSPGSTPARRSPAGSRARTPKPFKYKDKGTMATIGRGAAVVQMLGGRTMTGTRRRLAWGAVHLALLPTNEDRAKAVVDWAGATFTHQRAGRISIGDE